MSTPVETFLSALRTQGRQPQRSGASWCCTCPAHDDRNPSLSIKSGDDGRALVHCHAGCSVDEVCRAIGLRPSDLFTEHPFPRRGGAVSLPHTRRRGDGDENTENAANHIDSVTVASDADSHEGGRAFPTAREAVAELERSLGPRSATWFYHNAAREPVGLITRWDTPEGKIIRPISRKTDGSRWCIGGMPTPRPLYGLPDLLAMPTGVQVFVAEGEKAADAARAIGLVATTSPHGAKSASKTDWSPLAGREVVILPDNDESGERYADDVARLAMAAGANSVRIVRLVDLWPEMPKGGDMADLVKLRGGDANRIRSDLEGLVTATQFEETTTLNGVSSPSPAFRPFPTHALPEPIRDLVDQAAKAIGCDTSFIALPLLSGLASAIGTTHRIQLKHGWTEPAIVWSAIVGESGTAKSPALELALRPIRKRQNDAMKQHAKSMTLFESELAKYERDAALWKRKSSDAPPPKKPETPIADRCWTDDATTEALAVLLQQNPRGLLMVRDELAGWFNFDRYTGGKGGGDVAKWLEMHGGRPMVVDRKAGGTLHVLSAAVSIAGGIQPETLRRALVQEHRENGLAARLLLANPPRKRKRWTEAEINANTEAAVASVFDRLFALTPETDDNGHDRPRLVTLADDGKFAWVKFYNEHSGEQVNLSGDEAAAWSKLEGYVPRIALVVHLTRWAAGDVLLRDASQVDETSIAAGVELARWFGDETRRVYAILSENDDDRKSRRLVEWIERKGGTVTVRDLTRGPREYRGDSERAFKTLSDLVAKGVAVWDYENPTLRGGRPAERIRLVSQRGSSGAGDETSVSNRDGWGSVTVAAPTDADEDRRAL